MPNAYGLLWYGVWNWNLLGTWNGFFDDFDQIRDHNSQITIFEMRRALFIFRCTLHTGNYIAVMSILSGLARFSMMT